jgi:glyoxylase-like metal-dependent hydrolase (beta-lactamase superfamily II)/8-oxo-dGTP pyrophosphatase MutT (NUDIX family)
VPEIVTPRPASTLIIVRDGEAGMEVLLGEKTSKVNFAAGAFVFPGGALDESDFPDNFTISGKLSVDKANQILGVSDGGLSYWIAAIRECFEEIGVLFAAPARGGMPSEKEFVAFESNERKKLERGEVTFHEALKHAEFSLEIDQLHYFSRWVTHAGSPRRYDTRFFIARMPQGQIARHDGGELVDHRWVKPDEALRLNSQGELNLMFPTQKTIEKLQEFSDVEEALSYTLSAPPATPMEPRLTVGAEGKKLLVPGDFAYAEAGKLDPEQLGTVSREIKAGVVVQLDKRVSRLTAPNASIMTGPGTNTYILGDDVNGHLVIDPGPDDSRHIQLIRDLTSDRVAGILCTHTHIDHSPGAAPLRRSTGAPVFGRLAENMERQDSSFVPDKELSDGDELKFGDLTIDVLHTPGHASNHLCFLFAEARMLFTGDHIMQGSTVVINPPDGDMSAYFSSLNKLYDYQFDWIAPGHGFLMDNPHEAVNRLLIHRQKRETKIVNALSVLGEGTVDELVIHAYDDVSEALHQLAKRSLLAHLEKLHQEGKVNLNKDTWASTSI